MFGIPESAGRCAKKRFRVDDTGYQVPAVTATSNQNEPCFQGAAGSVLVRGKVGTNTVDVLARYSRVL